MTPKTSSNGTTSYLAPPLVATLNPDGKGPRSPSVGGDDDVAPFGKDSLDVPPPRLSGHPERARVGSIGIIFIDDPMGGVSSGGSGGGLATGGTGGGGRGTNGENRAASAEVGDSSCGNAGMLCPHPFIEVDREMDDDDSLTPIPPNSSGGGTAQPGTGGGGEGNNGPPKNSSLTPGPLVAAVSPESLEKPRNTFLRSKDDDDELGIVPSEGDGGGGTCKNGHRRLAAVGGTALCGNEGALRVTPEKPKGNPTEDDDGATRPPSGNDEGGKPAGGSGGDPGGEPATNTDPEVALTGSVGGMEDLAALGDDSISVKPPPLSPDDETSVIPVIHKLPNEDDSAGGVSSVGSGGGSVGGGTGGGGKGTNGKNHLHEATLASWTVAALQAVALQAVSLQVQHVHA